MPKDREKNPNDARGRAERPKDLFFFNKYLHYEKEGRGVAGGGGASPEA